MFLPPGAFPSTLVSFFLSVFVGIYGLFSSFLFIPYFYKHLQCMMVARPAVMQNAALALVVFGFAKVKQRTPLSAV
jgi:hypothetical protein